ncbi:MAG: aldo/keto reductase [Desulfovibrionaceae bacterium]|nr:aldo/keto reductase [Desulfovibrionaceae bacterium]
MPPRLGFGFMRLPLLDKSVQTSFDYGLLNSLVDTFLEKGFSYFDTALTYHETRSEEALRKALVERHPRERFAVASKLPPRIIREESDQERYFSAQLERCGVEWFDAYLLHNIGLSAYKNACHFDSFGFVQRKKEQGMIRRIGMSFHDTPELLDEILSAHPELDFVQLQINYLDWENECVQSRRCYEVARRHKLPIVVMEPCKGGNLAQVPQEAEALLKARDANASVPSWAFRFAGSLPGVETVLSGMNAMPQLLDNASVFVDFKPLDEDDLAILRQVSDIINAEKAVPCTGCRYCVAGCPQHIAIPEYFSLYNNARRSVTQRSSLLSYYLNLTSRFGRAGDCQACGACQKACPQHIDIPSFLKEVSATFDGRSLRTPK